jgi:signal transduction histidine kinase
MPETGRIVITTRQKKSDIEVEIRDEGKGLSADELANMFEPVFVADQNRMAAGNWGLFSSREIVWQHGGEIEIKSSSGKGTAVWVRLPL